MKSEFESSQGPQRIFVEKLLDGQLEDLITNPTLQALDDLSSFCEAAKLLNDESITASFEPSDWFSKIRHIVLEIKEMRQALDALRDLEFDNKAWYERELQKAEGHIEWILEKIANSFNTRRQSPALQ